MEIILSWLFVLHQMANDELRRIWKAVIISQRQYYHRMCLEREWETAGRSVSRVSQHRAGIGTGAI